MNCIKCNAPLDDTSYCPRCGCDVTAVKKAAALSNLYYNQGLEKAQIRDLSGAVICLKRSLRMNKLNIQARNLLGLVYFETGEAVEALSQWVISKNMLPEGNPAVGYIDKLQKNASRLEAVNNSIHKFNQSLEGCRNGNEDMAKIQLKSVLSANPRLVKGYHLLALIYIHEGEYEKARKQLKAAAKIDKANTTTLRFLKEVEQQTGRATNLESRFRMKEHQEKKAGTRIYMSGNDSIVQPPDYRERTITNTLVNLVVGLLLGGAALWFLIVPAKTQKINEEANKKVVEYSDKMAAQTAELSRLQEEMEASAESVDTANTQITAANDKTASYENLLKAWQAYSSGSYDTAANALEGIQAEDLSVEAKGMYDLILADIGATMQASYKEEGIDFYNEGNYDSALESLEKALAISEDDSDTMYFCARAYDRKGDTENANKWYQKIIDKFPGTNAASDARDYLAANGVVTEPETSYGGTDYSDSDSSGYGDTDYDDTSYDDMDYDDTDYSDYGYDGSGSGEDYE